MAIDINLNIYNAAGTNHLSCIHLYFGPQLVGFGDEFKWVESIGMTVDGPWAYADGTVRHHKNVSKKQLKSWIDGGYLCREFRNKDSSFLNEFPDNSLFNLWFVDWS